MQITHFDDLIAAAHSQAQPQRLLMVFVKAELPADASAAEREAFQQGSGGTLSPLTCVDKTATELPSFAALADEAAQLLPDWDLVFAAAASETLQAPLPPSAIDAALQSMIASIDRGDLSWFLAFDRTGEAVRVS